MVPTGVTRQLQPRSISPAGREAARLRRHRSEGSPGAGLCRRGSGPDQGVRARYNVAPARGADERTRAQHARHTEPAQYRDTR